MKRDNVQNNEFYTYLKHKYRLTDADMGEFIESFIAINRGEPITPYALKSFVSDEIDDSNWSMDECRSIIVKINFEIHGKMRNTLDVKTYLTYVIPKCSNNVITKIGIREIFDSLDSDLDGKITCNELMSLIYKLNKQLDSVELISYKQQIEKMCQSADIDNDGFISYDEFKKFILEKGIAYGIPPLKLISEQPAVSDTIPEEKPLPNLSTFEQGIAKNPDVCPVCMSSIKNNSQTDNTSKKDFLNMFGSDTKRQSNDHPIQYPDQKDKDKDKGIIGKIFSHAQSAPHTSFHRTSSFQHFNLDTSNTDAHNNIIINEPINNTKTETKTDTKIETEIDTESFQAKVQKKLQRLSGRRQKQRNSLPCQLSKTYSYNQAGGPNHNPNHNLHAESHTDPIRRRSRFSNNNNIIVPNITIPESVSSTSIETIKNE